MNELLDIANDLGKNISDMWNKITELVGYGKKDQCTISEENLEEYKMISGLETKDIVRTYDVYVSCCQGNEFSSMSLAQFLEIPCIACNPLRDRIAIIFGFGKEKETISFKEFLSSVSIFNSPGGRDQKMKIAFQIQDFDGDGLLSRQDLETYLNLITKNGMSVEDVTFIVDEMMKECDLDPKGEFINLSEFQRIVAPSDFQAKLRLQL